MTPQEYSAPDFTAPALARAPEARFEAVPALRDRVEDIPALARVLLDGLAQDIGRPAIGLAPDCLLYTSPSPRD